MKQYIDILKRILEEGEEKFPTRYNEQTGKHEPVDGGVKTLTIPNVFFSHNMEDGFPLLTTRKMPIKSSMVELEGFINGITSKSWYEERGCNFWSYWCRQDKVPNYIDDDGSYVLEKDNEFAERCLSSGRYRKITNEERKKYQLLEDDLGKIYSYQMRSFGGGNDQLKTILDKLRDNQSDRRMVCSYWNPNDISESALPPCHLMWVVTTSGNKLNLSWMQRSNDFCIGNPNNISFYAVLLLLLSKHANLLPGNLSCLMCDCHIYENQIELAREQIKREPKQLPTLEILSNSEQTSKFDVLKWTHKDIKLHNYNPHPRIKYPKPVV